AAPRDRSARGSGPVLGGGPGHGSYPALRRAESLGEFGLPRSGGGGLLGGGRGARARSTPALQAFPGPSRLVRQRAAL
ncbi:hypothetical protein AVDCRST_MAG82-3071, partial [uncultured Rubrobacteraceae bacterium]